MVTQASPHPTPNPPRAPENTRVYAIGDVHGRRDLLDRLLDDIDHDAADYSGRKVLILLGDLVDRGADSNGVLTRCRQLKAGEMLPDFEVRLLKGNHEDLMVRFLAGKDRAAVWRGNGGDATMASYALDPDGDGEGQGEGLRQVFAEILPDDHKRLLDGLELGHAEGDYAFVHAGVRPGVPWAEQRAEDLMWIREAFLDSDADFGRIVVHGHTPRPDPVVRANRIGIDTRAWESGVLTCLVLEGTGRRFLTT